MENGAIQDTQLSASSEDLLYEVSKARLQSTYDGWRGTKADKKPWCQIDFKTNATVKVFISFLYIRISNLLEFWSCN